MIENRLEFSSDSYRQSLSLPSVKVSFSLSKLNLLDKRMIAMKYSTLLATARNVVASDSDSTNPEKTAANFTTAVRSWLVFIGKDAVKHNVGPELNTTFEEGLSNYMSEMLAAGLSPSTVRDRKSAIRRLHSIYKTHASIDENLRSSELGVELRRIMLKLDMSAKELARRSNVSFSFIQRVLTGSRPQKEIGLKNLRRIEFVLLGLGAIESKGHFLDLLKCTPSKATDKPSSELLNPLSIEEANAHFQNKSSSPLSAWSLSELKSLTPSVYSFLQEYFSYKNEQRAWSLKSPSRRNLNSRLLWLFRQNGKIVHAPAFERYLAEVASMMCFLRDYQNIPVSQLDNPLIFSEKGLYLNYMSFLAERRGGKICGAGRSVVALASELIKEVARQLKSGLLVSNSTARDFDVAESISEVRKYYKRFSNSGRVRDPWELTAPLLELEDPALPLANLSKFLGKKASAPQVYLSHAIDLRDSFLSAFLLALPVRERTCIHLTYKDDGSGHLRYSKKDGAWRIEIPANQVKNQREISRTLPRFLNATIERYLGEARPRILETWGDEALGIDVLFVSCQRNRCVTRVVDELTGELYELTRGQMQVSARLGVVTKKYLGLPIRTHSFRHITATRFLKLNPGQYQACADLLADSIETVMKHYAYHDPSWNEKCLNESISAAFGVDVVES